MRSFRIFPLAAFLLPLLPLLPGQAQQAASPPLPAIPQLMREVEEHQKSLEKVQENYTYSSSQTTEILDGKSQVKKTESTEHEVFFVNSHPIERLVKKKGKLLSDHDQQKETERVTKLVEKAEKTPPDQPLEGHVITISVSRILEIMDVRNPRRENYRGRATIVFDFVGRKNAKTHGMAEDLSKKLQGTIWIDEADREIAHCDASFDDNFHIAGGLLINIEKGSNFHFDQAPVNGEIWLSTGSEFFIQARVLLAVKGRAHMTERDYGYKRFHVEAQQGKDSKVVVEKKP
jgi:SepF-like predicted cell division protein (DUF552 family)